MRSVTSPVYNVLRSQYQSVEREIMTTRRHQSSQKAFSARPQWAEEKPKNGSHPLRPGPSTPVGALPSSPPPLLPNTHKIPPSPVCSSTSGFPTPHSRSALPAHPTGTDPAALLPIRTHSRRSLNVPRVALRSPGGTLGAVVLCSCNLSSPCCLLQVPLINVSLF